MKTLGGFVAFVIVWTLLQWLGSAYLFKDIHDSFPQQFSWLLWYGGATMCLAVLADKIVSAIHNQTK